MGALAEAGASGPTAGPVAAKPTQGQSLYLATRLTVIRHRGFLAGVGACAMDWLASSMRY